MQTPSSQAAENAGLNHFPTIGCAALGLCCAGWGRLGTSFPTAVTSHQESPGFPGKEIKLYPWAGRGGGQWQNTWASRRLLVVLEPNSPASTTQEHPRKRKKFTQSKKHRAQLIFPQRATTDRLQMLQVSVQKENGPQSLKPIDGTSQESQA